MELLKLDVVECLLRSCFQCLHGGKSLSFQCFFSLSGIKRNHRGLGLVNRVGGDGLSIPETPNTRSQTKLCEMGCCHVGETNHLISTILGIFFTNSLSVASKPPSKIPDWQSIQEERIPSARFLEHRRKQWASFSHLISLVLLFSISVKWASSIGPKLVWSQGHTHSTNFCHPWWH